MMDEVRIFDGNGNLKKVMSGKEVSKDYWHRFNNPSKGPNAKKTSTGDVGSRNIPGPDYDCVCVICQKEFKGMKPNSACCHIICEKKRRSAYQKDRYRKIQSGEVTVKKGARRGPAKSAQRGTKEKAS